ncbi:hypothetical protein C8R48DRAFT_676922 [Suillus tomentosus]|nr:hypothetical protein C8R48DRAFT_676922 [Suillus tomentosus]
MSINLLSKWILNRWLDKWQEFPNSQSYYLMARSDHQLQYALNMLSLKNNSIIAVQSALLWRQVSVISAIEFIGGWALPRHDSEARSGIELQESIGGWALPCHDSEAWSGIELQAAQSALLWRQVSVISAIESIGGWALPCHDSEAWSGIELQVSYKE